MPFITLFSAPKPFNDAHIAMIQRNAIKSWSLLPDVEVILLGGETGLAENARELGVKHLPNVERSDSGAPLISSMFQRSRENSRSELLCIVNSDMVLMSDFVQAAEQVMKLKERFVMLSQRWDLDVTVPIEFKNGWQDSLCSTVHMRGTLHRPAGSDFFLFPRACYMEFLSVGSPQGRKGKRCESVTVPPLLPGTKAANATVVLTGRCGSRTIRKSEDLPATRSSFGLAPRGLGERTH